MMNSPERLFLLDGMALAYRAYFALISRPLINSKGDNTSAIFGFVNMLMKILDEEKPDHVAVVFDTKEPTFRHKKYPAYKATRQKMPEDMAAQLEKLKEVVRAFNTPLIEVPGYEADDIIGTLAKRAEKEGVVTFMVTGDKDFMQLISPLVKMYKPGKSGGEVEIVEEAGVLERFGVPPDKVADVLGLTGDKSDNVPGVPGIGDKTAIPLIQKYGHIEELYARLEEVTQKGVRKKLAEHKDKAFLSRELVTIHTDVPVPIDFHQLRAAARDTAKLITLFTDLEFRGIIGRLKTEETQPPEPRASGRNEAPSAEPPPVESLTDINTDNHTYICITSPEALEELCRSLEGAQLFVFDTETTSTNAMEADLVGLSFCIKEREAFYIPVRSEARFAAQDGQMLLSHDHTAEALPLPMVIERLRPIMENPRIKKVGQNAKYDMLVLMNAGIRVEGIAADTMVASYVLRPDGQHGLDALAVEHLRYRPISYADLVGTGKNRKHIKEVPLEAITTYSAEDADITMRVYHRQMEQLERAGLLELCQDIEFPLVAVLTRMEAAGVSLDKEYLAAMSKDLERQLDALVRAIHQDAGEQFNINSTQQLAQILFERLHLPTVRKTKTGFSTDVSVLETLQGEHPIVEKLLEYRQLTKLKSTYIDALPLLVHPKTGRVHTSFNQTVAATGRLSSSDPNLQNIPIRTEIGRAIRKAFVPGARENLLMSADYSQIELRVMAHVSGDEALVEAFRNKEDIHATTASRVFGVRPADVTRDMRRRAKEVNFGIMYGIGPFGLSNRLDITQTEARDIITRYFERFPKVKQYINDTLDTVRRTGYVSTVSGRRRYLPEITSRNQNIRSNAERQAINMPIQGTAADMIKLAMVHIDHGLRMRELSGGMLLQVHDELVFELPESEISTVQPFVVHSMQTAMKLNVPIEVEVGTGRNWLETH